MVMKTRFLLITVSVFVGCSSSSPTVVRNSGTETTQVNGVTIASMRHQSCYESESMGHCADANGHTFGVKKESAFGGGVVTTTADGQTVHTTIEPKAVTVIDVGVKAYPAIKGLFKLIN